MSMAIGKGKSAEVGSPASLGAPRPGEQLLCPRQFRHGWSDSGGLNSICMKCRVVIATSRDEWSLLACERLHVCESRKQASRKRSGVAREISREQA